MGIRSDMSDDDLSVWGLVREGSEDDERGEGPKDRRRKKLGPTGIRPVQSERSGSSIGQGLDWSEYRWAL